MKESDYYANIEILKSRDPNNSMLRLITRSYSPINVIYLQDELNNIPVKEEPQLEELTEQKIHPALNDLKIKKSHINNSIRKLSNDFHKCSNDSARASVSIAIKELIRKKKDIQTSIAYYLDNASAPEDPDVKKELPEEPIELYKRQKAIKDNIRYHKKKIDISILKGDADDISRREIIIAKKRIELSHVKKYLAAQGYASR